MAKTNKTVCPVTRHEFLTKAEPLHIKIGEQVLVAEAREFATGSFGWYVNAKTTAIVDGKSVSVQVGANLIVVGSKEAKAGGETHHPAPAGGDEG